MTCGTYSVEEAIAQCSAGRIAAEPKLRFLSVQSFEGKMALQEGQEGE
jgi:hypothetical protein